MDAPELAVYSVMHASDKIIVTKQDSEQSTKSDKSPASTELDERYELADRNIRSKQ